MVEIKNNWFFDDISLWICIFISMLLMIHGMHNKDVISFVPGFIISILLAGELELKKK